MGGFGFMANMINTLRENAKVLTLRKSPTEKSADYKLKRKPQPLKYENRCLPKNTKTS